MSSGINGLLIAVFVFSIAFPLGLLVWWKKRTGAELKCFIAGAACFAVFALGLESIVHYFCLTGDNRISAVITGSPVLYMLYASLAAGVFEETGRLFGFKVLLKNHDEPECAAAYGIGHGGMEVVLLVGMSYLVMILALAGVQIGNEAAAALAAEAAGAISFPSACTVMFERISAMLLHIGLSMIMFTACRQKGKLWLYPVAIFLHALADAPAALYQFHAIDSIAVVEVTAFILGIACMYAGKKLMLSYSAGLQEQNREGPEADS